MSPPTVRLGRRRMEPETGRLIGSRCARSRISPLATTSSQAARPDFRSLPLWIWSAGRIRLESDRPLASREMDRSKSTVVCCLPGGRQSGGAIGMIYYSDRPAAGFGLAAAVGKGNKVIIVVGCWATAAGQGLGRAGGWRAPEPIIFWRKIRRIGWDRAGDGRRRRVDLLGRTWARVVHNGRWLRKPLEWLTLCPLPVGLALFGSAAGELPKRMRDVFCLTETRQVHSSRLALALGCCSPRTSGFGSRERVLAEG